MRIFITGAASPLGQSLTRMLVGEGHEVAGQIRRSARIPSRSQARRITRTMERLGNKVMAGVDVKLDSLGSKVELPPPNFDKP
jgi:NADP-dependent 3-hydroxy acid dehydrogenase YdfG